MAFCFPNIREQSGCSVFLTNISHTNKLSQCYASVRLFCFTDIIQTKELSQWSVSLSVINQPKESEESSQVCFQREWSLSRNRHRCAFKENDPCLSCRPTRPLTSFHKVCTSKDQADSSFIAQEQGWTALSRSALAQGGERKTSRSFSSKPHSWWSIVQYKKLRTQQTRLEKGRCSHNHKCLQNPSITLPKWTHVKC